MVNANNDIRGLLIDLDGTVYEGDAPIRGVSDAINRLRVAGVALRFTTNTTRKPRSALVAKLHELGISVESSDIHTAPLATATWCRQHGWSRLKLLLAAETFEDFGGFDTATDDPEALIIGDLGPAWTFERLNNAFRLLMAGTEFVALQRNRYWRTGGELALDAGAFVAALEYASGKAATVVGKPNIQFFETATAGWNLPNEQVAVVGDDLRTDIEGARAVGMPAIAVRTGKYRLEDEVTARRNATAVLGSLAELPNWLGL